MIYKKYNFELKKNYYKNTYTSLGSSIIYFTSLNYANRLLDASIFSKF